MQKSNHHDTLSLTLKLKKWHVLVLMGTLAFTFLWISSRLDNPKIIYTPSQKEVSGVRFGWQYDIHGIDVSHYQQKIDWLKVTSVSLDDKKKLITFAFLKATEGEQLVDTFYEYNWRETKKHKIKRGAYHFYVPWASPEKQAQNFIRVSNLEKGDLAPVLDIETSASKKDSKVVQDLRLWLKLVRNHYKVKPIIYTNHSFYSRYIRGNFDDYPLWLADYSSIRYNGEYANALFWQYTNEGRLKGINEKVDLNVFLKSAQEIHRYCIQ